MALHFLSGSETGDNGEWDALEGSPTGAQGTTVRTGNYAFLAEAGGGANKDLYSTITNGTGVVWMRFAYRFGNNNFADTDTDIMELQTAGGVTTIVRISMSDGELPRVTVTGSTQQTGSTQLAINTWHIFRLKYQVSSGSSDGICELYVNGTLEASDNNHNNTTTVEEIRINTGSTGPTNNWYDDIIVTSDGDPGDGGCVALVPNADDSTRDDFVATGGGSDPTWDDVDEIPLVGTDRASSDLSGAGIQEQEWELTTQSGVGPIHGAKVHTSAFRGAAGVSEETIAPNGIADSTNYTTLNLADIDEDPDSPDGAWGTWDGNGDTICGVNFPTPSANPSGSAQEFRVLIRKSASGGNDTTWALQLREGGIQVGSNLATGTTTSTTGEVVSGTWNAASLGTADGSAVQCYLVQTGGGGGAPASRRGVEVGAVEWNADVEDLGITHHLTANNVNQSARSVSGDLGLTLSGADYEYVPTGLVVPTSQADINSYRIGAQTSASGQPRMTISNIQFHFDYSAPVPIQPSDLWHRVHAGLLAQ